MAELVKYGAISTMDVALYSASDPKVLATGLTLVSGDAKVNRDGGGLETLDTLPVASGNHYRVSVSVAESTCKGGIITIEDQDGPAFFSIDVPFITYGHPDAMIPFDLSSDWVAMLMDCVAAARNKITIDRSTGETRVYEDNGTTVRYKRQVQEISPTVQGWVPTA